MQHFRVVWNKYRSPNKSYGASDNNLWGPLQELQGANNYRAPPTTIGHLANNYRASPTTIGHLANNYRALPTTIGHPANNYRASLGRPNLSLNAPQKP